MSLVMCQLGVSRKVQVCKAVTCVLNVYVCYICWADGVQKDALLNLKKYFI